MRILEPATVATDYLLGAASLWFAGRLWRMRRGAAWPLVFLFTAVGSIAGGTFHGLGGGTALWKITTIAIGLASFFLLVAVRVPLILALAKFMAYATWMIRHDEFVYVIVDYGISLLVVVTIEIVLWFRSRAPEAPWIIGSVLMSIVAAVVQQQQIDLHAHFNHNDLYHVVQLVALWLLYRGAAAMESTGTAIAPSNGGG